MSATEQHQSTGTVGEHIVEIAGLASDLLSELGRSLDDISEINRMIHVVSMNARVEAARASQHGRGFAIVAEETTRLARCVSDATQKLGRQAHTRGSALRERMDSLEREVRDTRLCELALNNIDLVDRNLYERSCDVRWWASDAAAVACATSAEAADCRHATQRLGQILDSYTVYFDLVLAALDGRILANGRPQRYRSVDARVDGAAWLCKALATRSGTEYGFETVHASSLVGGRRVLVYSCAIREGGRVAGRPLGALGIVFDWDSLAQTIVQRTPLSQTEWERTRVCIVDDAGCVLANAGAALLGGAYIEFPGREVLFAKPRASVQIEHHGARFAIAHAASPGFETYRSGWHSLIIQAI